MKKTSEEKIKKVEVVFEDGKALVKVDGMVKMVFPEEMIELSVKKDGVPLSEVLNWLV